MAKIQPKRKTQPAQTQDPKFDADRQEEALSKLNKKKVHRVTIDFPITLFEKIEAETEETGQTFKGFFVGLARDYFKEKEIRERQ